MVGYCEARYSNNSCCRTVAVMAKPSRKQPLVTWKISDAKACATRSAQPAATPFTSSHGMGTKRGQRGHGMPTKSAANSASHRNGNSQSWKSFLKSALSVAEAIGNQWPISGLTQLPTISPDALPRSSAKPSLVPSANACLAPSFAACPR